MMEWLKKYWYIPFVGLLLILAAGDLVKPPRINKKRSHHGVNKYGETY